MKILMIEDDEELAKSIKGVFETFGHKVLWANNGQGACEVNRDGFWPDVVLCDWNLGIYDHRNGAEICTAIREIMPEARFIVMSGLDRKVPEWCEFVSKGNFPELMRMVAGDD